MEIEKFLQQFCKESGSSRAILVNSKFKTNISFNLEHQDSIGAMSRAIESMCNKYIDDLQQGELKDIILKTSQGYIIFKKVTNISTLVVYNNTLSNLGLYLHTVDQLCEKLKSDN
jgi:predicted regulator of Ras-like GTPase activity (Roadblock/LC7/MglB family)